MAGLVALVAASGTPAATGDWVDVELGPNVFVSMRLVSAVDDVGNLETVPAGLHVVLPDGWKTYWRSPGDAGLPPSLDFAGSQNVADTELLYPVPHRFSLFGLDTYGYESEVVFPIDIAVAEPGAPLRATAETNLLVCSDICVPAIGTLGLALGEGPGAPDGRTANLINRYRSIVPDAGGASGLALERLVSTETVIDGETVPALRLEATAREPLAAPDVFVEFQPFWAFGAPDVALSEDGRRLVATIPASQMPSQPGPLDGAEATVTIADGNRAAEFQAVIGAAGGAGSPAAAPAAGGPAVTWAILLTAFLGGLILNVMPCVLPVLSIKLFGVLNHGRSDRAAIRRGFVASAAGIVFSFLLLAGAAIGARSLGATVAWGVQFQQPLFLVFMVVLLTLFTANMAGLFEIRLPGVVGDRAARVGNGGTLAGDFGTGMFATLLATPCSAPFVGTALGFAFSQGSAAIVTIFAAMGLGLAAPYVLVAVFPSVARRLPRPGAWMIWVKRLLALALAGTAAWLLTVLAAQVSSLAASLVGGLMVVILAVLWLRRLAAGGSRLVLAGTVAAVAMAAFVLPATLPRDQAAATADPTGWVAFDEQAIATRVAAGEVVLVDVTADWCITCLANKSLVLDVEPVASLLAGDNVVPMQADWTRPDDAIAAYLARHGRYGIPFNIVYGPAAPDGIALPELLSRAAVVEALEAAGLDATVLADAGLDRGG
ncbi:MAG: protein-disulfide reductase DsbD family protein [Azospirillaceae bacterium]